VFRALFLKEWRQLRTLRWGALIVTLVLPFALLVGAEASRRGWAFATVKEYSTRTLWGEAFPLTLVAAVWPLFTAMITAHAWCAERREGTVAFLLARPAPASKVWWAKLGAAALSVVTVIAGGLLVAVPLALAVMPFDKIVELAQKASNVWVLLLGTLAGSAVAAAVVPSTLFAGLLGILLCVGVGYAGIQLMELFPYARNYVEGAAGKPASMVFWLFVPGFAVASFRAFTRGEPAGGRRGLRTGLLLGLVAAVVVASFIATAWGMVRWYTTHPPHGREVIAPSGGAAFFLGSEYGLQGKQLVDARSASILASLPPPTAEVAWKRDGSVAAVASNAGVLGSVRENSTLLFLRADGTEAAPPIELPMATMWQGSLEWSGDRVVAIGADFDQSTPEGFRWRLCVVDPRARTIRELDTLGVARHAWLERPADSGDLFVNLISWEWDSTSEARILRRPWEIHRLDDGSLRLAPEANWSGKGLPLFRGSVSPSGRYLIAELAGTAAGSRVVVDRRDGQAVPLPASRNAVWIVGDTVAWLESSDRSAKLLLAAPGAAPTTIGEWPDAKVRFSPSPDRRRLLVSGDVRAVWDSETRAWTPLNPFGADKDRNGVEWAGPKTVAWSAREYLVLADLDSLDQRRVVFGKDPFVKGPAEN
jgi:hypothetical protein